MTPTHIRTEVDRLLSLVRSGDISDAWARRFVGDMHDRLTLGQTLSPSNAEKIISLAGRY
jgi:hypothetical protein